jgi:chromosome segregation ATPase
MSKITRLEVSNFKRIRTVAIEPDGAIVAVRGRNGAGKSSCLDAIAAALGGEKLAPAEPIRRGTDGAVVRIEMDDGTTVERRWTASGSTLKLMSKEGAKFDKPQKRLDDLIGRLSFDPLAFSRLPAKEQAETLRKLAGVDFTLLDGKRRAAYDGRTEANRQLASAKARLAAIPVVDAPDSPVSAADLLEEQDRRRAQHDANEAKRRALSAARAKYSTFEGFVACSQADVAKLEKALEDARALLVSNQRALEALKEPGKALKSEVEQLVDPNLDEIPAKLREVETVNELVRQKKARATEAEHVKAAETAAAKLDAEITAIDAQKAAALAEANLPVKGLAFTDECVTFDGLPLSQASQAQQLRVSVAIGSALNPKLRAMLVRDGSLLDEDSLALLKDEAERADLQVWLEMVGRTGDGIVIEDGLVEGAEVVKEVANG